MAKFIGINPMFIGYGEVHNMFDIGLNSFRHVPYIEMKPAMNNKAIIWIRDVNDLTQALTLHSIGLTNKEIQASLYDIPSLIPQ